MYYAWMFKIIWYKINICKPIVNNNPKYKVVALTWQDMSEFIQMKGKITRYNI